MTFKRITSGGAYEEKVGYCRAVVAGGWVHVSGTVGQGETVEAQCADILQTIKRSLQDAGATFEQVVRVRYMLPVAADFEACWPQLQAAFGAHPPAATMVQCALISPEYLIEIEVTAWLGE